MNQSWCIIRVKTPLREAYVARQIGIMGFQAWVPESYSTSRICRVSKKRKLIARPLMSKCLFAAVPEARHGDLQRIRYFDSLQRDSASQALAIPEWQVRRFMDYLAEENETTLRQMVSKKLPATKTRWIKLGPANAAAILNQLFGMEMAA